MESLLDPSVTTTWNADSARPSLFELLAQEQLRSLLQPAARYLLATLAIRFPRYLIPISNRHEEYYSLLLLIIERHHLKNHAASLSEHFYGLRRQSILPIKTPRLDSSGLGSNAHQRTSMKPRQLWASLATLVLLPYLRLKLHDLFLMLGGLSDASIIGSTSDHVSNSTEDPRPTRRQTIQRLLQHAFLQLYPWTNLAWTVSAVGWNLAYLFGKTRFWGLEGWALGLVMARAERVDLPIPPPSSRSPFTLSEIYKSLPSLLPTLLLSLKFLEFYHSPTLPFALLSGPATRSSSISKDSHASLPPPSLPTPTEEGHALLARKRWDDCPLCGTCWRAEGRTPTVDGRRGGYIFCWGCIWDHLGHEEKGRDRCPVSGSPMMRADLRKMLI